MTAAAMRRERRMRGRRLMAKIPRLMLKVFVHDTRREAVG
jgi:hypothetical protein